LSFRRNLLFFAPPQLWVPYPLRLLQRVGYRATLDRSPPPPTNLSFRPERSAVEKPPYWLSSTQPQSVILSEGQSPQSKDLPHRQHPHTVEPFQPRTRTQPNPQPRNQLVATVYCLPSATCPTPPPASSPVSPSTHPAASPPSHPSPAPQTSPPANPPRASPSPHSSPPPHSVSGP